MLQEVDIPTYKSLYLKVDQYTSERYEIVTEKMIKSSQT